MVMKAKIQNQHHEAFRAEQFDQIPVEVLPAIVENYSKLPDFSDQLKALLASGLVPESEPE